MIHSHAEAMYAHDLTCQNLGITIDEIGPGHVVLAMRVSDAMVNGHGIAHGGYLFLLADAAFAYASNSYGPVAVAQTAHMTFLRPADVGDLLLAAAVERSRQGRSGLYDVTVTRVGDPSLGPHEGDTVIAEMRGQSITLSGNPFPAQRATPAVATS
jgi:acyl-CoA thioesterase